MLTAELPAHSQLGAGLRRFVEDGDIAMIENVSLTTLQAGERLTVILDVKRSLVVSSWFWPPDPALT